MNIINEMTRAEAEAAAARAPLPGFDDTAHELYVATRVVKDCASAVAVELLGGEKSGIKRRWREERKRYLETRRFDLWLDRTGATWDSQRGKFVVFNS